MIKLWIGYTVFFGLIITIGYLQYGINPGQFTRDPLSILDGKFYMGALSNLGILLWTAAATICVFSYLVLFKKQKKYSIRRFLLHSGIFTTILLLDDFYMWHEEMFPTHLGIHEHVVYISYFIYLIVIFIKFVRTILNTEYLILASALFLMGCSVLVDVIGGKITNSIPEFGMAHMLVEDSFKSIGIFTWLIYYYRLSIDVIISDNLANQFKLNKSLQSIK